MENKKCLKPPTRYNDGEPAWIWICQFYFSPLIREQTLLTVLVAGLKKATDPISGVNHQVDTSVYPGVRIVQKWKSGLLWSTPGWIQHVYLDIYTYIYIVYIYIFLKLVFSWSPYYPYQPFYCQWYFSRQWFPPMNKIVIPAGCFTRSCHITGLILLAKVSPSTIIQHCWTTIFLSIKNPQ